MRPARAILLCAITLLTPAAGAQPGVGSDPPVEPVAFDGTRTGGYATVFTERSPLGTVAAVTERFRVQPANPPEDYVLADETFRVYVPEAYDGSEAYGLLVWINAGPTGRPPEHYLPVLDTHKLIWVGADNSGNPRSFWHRAGLALDGRRNILREYNIDRMRVYVSGISGGGRCASRIGPTYAELFAGAYPIIGADFFKRIPHPDNRGAVMKFWAPAFNPPNPQAMRRAKRDGRYVLLTGETDGNRPQMMGIYRYGYKRAKFAYVAYLEVPGMSHTLPPADWFAKGLAALDEPLEEVRARREEEAGHAFRRATDRLDRSRSHGIAALEKLLDDFNDTTYAELAYATLAETESTIPDTSDAEPEPEPVSLVDRSREDLALAKNYIAAGRDDLARPLLENTIKRVPGSEEAEEARQMLEKMDR
jgi:hypothetical protein